LTAAWRRHPVSSGRGRKSCHGRLALPALKSSDKRKTFWSRFYETVSAEFKWQNLILPNVPKCLILTPWLQNTLKSTIIDHNNKMNLYLLFLRWKLSKICGWHLSKKKFVRNGVLYHRSLDDFVTFGE
jgi:hypothetical protein